MKLVDVHAHLDDPRIYNNIRRVIENAKGKGQVLIISSGVNPETNRKVLEIANEFEIVKPSFGFYPIDSIAEKVTVSSLDDTREIKPFCVEKEMEWVEKNKDKCIAIGEIGLDFQIGAEHKNEQIEVFEKLLVFAKKLNKPVIIHSRKAEEECIKILEKHQMKKVIMHCFNGRKSLIRRCIENGWFLTVPPVIVRLDHFKVLTEITPLENLLTETDAPYLAPIKGEINLPQNVEVSIKEIARIKKIEESSVAEKIWLNAKNFFEIT
ncbi:MAG: TatD family hydrolase [Candidatus Pacearchaeota archaeon]